MLLTDLISKICAQCYLIIYTPEKLLYYGWREDFKMKELLLVHVNHIYSTIRNDEVTLAICLEDSEV